MELEIQNQSKNPLLGRETFTVQVDHQGEATPASDTLLNQFGAKNDFDIDHLSIGSIKTRYGIGTSQTTITVHDKPVRDRSEGSSGHEESSEDKEDSETNENENQGDE